MNEEQDMQTALQVASDALGDNIGDCAVAQAAMEMMDDVNDCHIGIDLASGKDRSVEFEMHGGNFVEVSDHNEEDGWNEYPECCPPPVDDFTFVLYIAETDRGVVPVYWHKYCSCHCFQTMRGDEEGMIGYGDSEFKVYRWMEMPKGKGVK